VDDTAVDVPEPDAGEEVVAEKDEDSLWLSSILSKPDITEAE
jgi:hypothetical protein